MSFEKWEPTIKRKNKKEEEVNMGRRNFLKAIGAAGLITIGSTLWKLAEFYTSKDDKADNERLETSEREKLEAAKDEEQETPEQVEIAEEDVKSIYEILDYKKEGKIEFNLGTVERIKNYWKKQYRENPKLRESLQNGYRQMGYLLRGYC